MERIKIQQPNDVVKQILQNLWGDSYNEIFNDIFKDDNHPFDEDVRVYGEIILPKKFPGEGRNIEDIEIGELDEDSQKTNKQVLILAYYTPMCTSSKKPGEITYCIKNIELYFGVLLRRHFRDKVKGRNLKICEVVTILRIILNTIYLHELFHYYSDYHFIKTGRKYDYLTEEALANAFAYKLSGNFTMSSENRFSECFNWLSIDIRFSDIRRLIFENITLDGYKDYKLFVGDKAGVEDLFNLKCFEYLTNQGMRDSVIECGFPKTNYWRELYMKYAINFDTNGLVYYIKNC